MSRIYAVPFVAVSVAAQQDVISINPAANKPVRILGFSLAQVGNSDVGDAQEEMFGLVIVRGNTVTGSGGSSVTPTPMDATGQAAGATCRANDTTAASSGTAVNCYANAFNIRAGITEYFPEELRPMTINGVFMCLRLTNTPADAVTLSGCLWIEELG